MPSVYIPVILAFKPEFTDFQQQRSDTSIHAIKRKQEFYHALQLFSPIHPFALSVGHGV